VALEAIAAPVWRDALARVAADGIRAGGPLAVACVDVLGALVNIRAVVATPVEVSIIAGILETVARVA
jgi:hypothetical protein